MIGKLKQAFRHFTGLQNGSYQTRKRKLDRYSDGEENEEKDLRAPSCKRIHIGTEFGSTPTEARLPERDLSEIIAFRVASVCQPILDKMSNFLWTSLPGNRKQKESVPTGPHFDKYSFAEESKENVHKGSNEDVQFLHEVPSRMTSASVYSDRKSLGAIRKSLQAPKTIMACKPDRLDPSLAAAGDEDEVQLVKVVNTSTGKKSKEDVFKSPNVFKTVKPSAKLYAQKRFQLIVKNDKKVKSSGSDKTSAKQHSLYSLNHGHYFGTRSSGKRALMHTYVIAKRESFAVNECVRLDDKIRYQQLLQQYTTTSILPSAYTAYKPLPNSSHLSSLGGENATLNSNSVGGILIQKLDAGTTAEMRESIDHQLETSKEAMLTKERKLSPESDVVHVNRSKEVTLRIRAGKQVHSKDSDIEIVRADISKNSLEQKLNDCPLYSHDWLHELNFKYDVKERERRRKMEEEELKRKILNEQKEEFEKTLEDRIRKQMRITEVALEEEEEEKEEIELPEITDEMEDLISHCLQPCLRDQVLCEAFKIKITRRDIETLAGLNWLNDEIINLYLTMIMERGKFDNFPSVYVFNTFFYPKLMSSGHAALKRWTRKVDVFSFDMIFIPVHLGMHWCLAVIDFRGKYVKYYDSMGGSNNPCLQALLGYLQAESMDKKKQTYDVSNWTSVNVQDIPQQMNGSDCGMFTVKYAEYLSRDAKITFTQQDMPYFRRRMVYEIVKQKLLYP